MSEAKAEDKPKKPFSPDLIKSIYMEELGGAGDRSPSLKRVMLLEISQVSATVWREDSMLSSCSTAWG